MTFNILKTFINECINEYIKEAAWGTFNLNKFKSLPNHEARVDYVYNSKLRKIGEGASKEVFALSPGKVLKISYRINDFQMRKEIETLKILNKIDPSIAPTLYDYDKDYGWMIVEPIQVFGENGTDFSRMKNILGIDTYVMNKIYLLKKLYERYQKIKTENLNITFEKFLKQIAKDKTGIFNIDEKIVSKIFLPIYTSNPMAKEFIDKIMFLTTEYNFIDIMRPDHWGLSVDGKIKVVDLGL